MLTNIKRYKIGAITYAKLVSLMLEGAYTIKELADHTGLHKTTVGHYTAALYKEKAAHICAWAPDDRGRYLCRVYKLGHGPDAKRPAPTPRSELTKRWRARRKQAQLSQVLAGKGRLVKSRNGRAVFEAAQD